MKKPLLSEGFLFLYPAWVFSLFLQDAAYEYAMVSPILALVSYYTSPLCCCCKFGYRHFIYSKSVSLVSEDYYKEGKGINQDLSRLEQAQKLGINANLTVSGKDAVIALQKGELKFFPTLQIEFQHRTLPEKDIQFTLNPDAGIIALILNQKCKDLGL